MLYDFDGDGDLEMFAILPDQPGEWGIVDFEGNKPVHRQDLSENLYSAAGSMRSASVIRRSAFDPLSFNFVAALSGMSGAEEIPTSAVAGILTDITKYRLGEKAAKQTAVENPDGTVTFEIDANDIFMEMQEDLKKKKDSEK